ncbi:hypothetical protein [Peribacillus sp. N1]
MVKKQIDEYQIYEKHYEQIHEQVKNDPYAQSLGIQLKNSRLVLQKQH